ncbi:MAG TPA: LacI family DNA-binding transcriptional regulator [Anaerolineae bacterium]|nr:LacI family DNA-binding transcriptional regulator [Anaerolineae bacterium]
MAATIRDVAKRAGVGLGTVSRVLNDSPQVSEATRKRVTAAITALNFVPNPTARRLSLGKTLTIAVIVPWFTRPAEVERLRGVENTLAESDYDLVLYNVETPEKRDSYFHDVPRSERADGVLIVSLSPRDDDVERLAHSTIPIILVDANHPLLKSLNRVITDDVAGGRAATQHLIDLGHRRIAYISDPIDTPFNFTSSRDRLLGYQQALQAAGIPFRSDYHGQGEHGRYEARRLAAEMLQQPDRPTAIFAASDTQALGVLEAAQDLNLRVPEDLSVIGYDDIEISEYIGLTTIRQMLYESGKRGVELLLDMLSNPTMAPQCEVLPTELVARKTTLALAS